MLLARSRYRHWRIVTVQVCRSACADMLMMHKATICLETFKEPPSAPYVSMYRQLAVSCASWQAAHQQHGVVVADGPHADKEDQTRHPGKPADSIGQRRKGCTHEEKT